MRRTANTGSWSSTEQVSALLVSVASALSEREPERARGANQTYEQIAQAYLIEFSALLAAPPAAGAVSRGAGELPAELLIGRSGSATYRLTWLRC
jgi:hypothetical protein